MKYPQQSSCSQDFNPATTIQALKKIKDYPLYKAQAIL